MGTQNSKLTFFKGKYLMSYDHNVRKRPHNQNSGKSSPPNRRPKVHQNHQWEYDLWRELSGFSEMELWCQEEPFDRKYADCKDPVKCLNSGKCPPPLLFKLFKNMHIRRCFNHNITKNAQICDISKSKWQRNIVWQCATQCSVDLTRAHPS